ncbi:MAG: hypothetical protein MUF10_10790 [Thermoanaerobaculaceae bacterium]|nr:hypothetical protein [Thermoanaerobaculaceae bacterium]
MGWILREAPRESVALVKARAELAEATAELRRVLGRIARIGQRLCRHRGEAVGESEGHTYTVEGWFADCLEGFLADQTEHVRFLGRVPRISTFSALKECLVRDLRHQQQWARKAARAQELVATIASHEMTDPCTAERDELQALVDVASLEGRSVDHWRRHADALGVPLKDLLKALRMALLEDGHFVDPDEQH